MKDTESKENLQYGKNSVLGGVFGDKDKRTKKGVRSLITTATAVGLMTVGLIGTKIQLNKYNYFLVNNTTPIGTDLTFASSKAVVSIDDVWTDSNKELTVVKLKYNDSAYQLLSSNGKNYNLYMATKQKDRPKKLEISYGMLGTDGNGFLFLKGQLEEKAYQVFLANQVKHISANSGGADSSKEISAINEKESMARSLAKYSTSDVDENGIFSNFMSNTENNDEQVPDNINFRINPYSMTTNIYNGSFLDKDGEIDYAKVVSVTSIQEVIEKLEKQISDREDEIKKMDATISEYQDRLEENPKDVSARTNIASLKSKTKQEKEKLRVDKTTLISYKDTSFNEKSFGKVQTKFEYLNLD